MFGISVPYYVCLITVGSNPISAPKFDPLRSRANDFIIDTKRETGEVEFYGYRACLIWFKIIICNQRFFYIV